MINIHCLKFDESLVEGWLNPDNTDRGIGWLDAPAPTRIIMKDFNPFPFQFPCSFDDLTMVRRVCQQQLSSAGCGLVEAELMDKHGLFAQPVKILWEIAKQPQNPSGMAYKGAMYIPLENTFFVLRVWCFEVGVTGVRDSFVLNELMSQGFKLDHNSADWGGWWVDDYGFGPAPIMRNLSEDAKYDLKFPDHPLSLTRNLLRSIEKSLRFEPPKPTRKGWLGNLFGN